MVPRCGRVLAVAAAAVVAGCAVNGGPGQERDGDAAFYAAEVQPIVARRCAYEGCHGREGMPLTLYAVDFLRLRDPQGDVDPARPELDERALAPAELDHNRRALAARVSAADPAGDEITQRLIPVAEGGIPHADVAVYPGPDHAELETLRVFARTVRAAR